MIVLRPLLGYGNCILRLHGESHLQSPLFRDIDWNWELRATPSCGSYLQNPNSIEAWELRATPSCGSHLQSPYLCILAHLGAHHSSHMPLGRVYSDYGLWDQLLVCLIYGFSSVSLRMKIIHDSEGSLRYELWIYYMELLLQGFMDIVKYD